MKVKGNIIKARLTFVKEHFGEDGWKQVLAAIPPSDREVLQHIIPNIVWFPFEFSKLLDETIVRVLGKGDSKVFEQIGAASARKNLSSVHQNLLEPGDPQAFLQKAPVVYRCYYDQGRREYTATSPTTGMLTTYDAETFSAADCLTVIGWYKEALKMCGAKTVFMSEEKCRAKGDEFCQYRVQWTM
jgi:uncharacterized protein (TIGR02265 family)